MSSNEKGMDKVEQFEKLSKAKSKQITELEKKNENLRIEIKNLTEELTNKKIEAERLRASNLVKNGKIDAYEKIFRLLYGKEEIRYYELPRESEEDID